MSGLDHFDGCRNQSHEIGGILTLIGRSDSYIAYLWISVVYISCFIFHHSAEIHTFIY
jgi:hypothetical protein